MCLTVVSVFLSVLVFGLIVYWVYQPGMEYVSKPGEGTLELDLQPDKSLFDEIDKLERQVIDDLSDTKANDNGIQDTSSSTTAVEFGILETEQSVKHTVHEMSLISTEETLDGGEHQEQRENKHSSDFNRRDSLSKITIKSSNEFKAYKLEVVDQSLTYHTKTTLSDGEQDGNIETEDIPVTEENIYQYQTNGNGIQDTCSSTTAVEFEILETEQESMSIKSVKHTVDLMSLKSSEETVDSGEHQKLEQSENKHSSDFNRLDSLSKIIKNSNEFKAYKLEVVDHSLTNNTKTTLSEGEQDGKIEKEDIPGKEENIYQYQTNGNGKHYGITPNGFPECHLQANDGKENTSTEISKTQSSDDSKALPIVNKEMSHELEFSVQMIILKKIFEFLVSLTRTITDFVKSCVVSAFDVIEVVVCSIIHLVRYLVLCFLEVPYCIVMCCKCILEMYIIILAFLWFACFLQLAIFLFYVITFVCVLLSVILNMKALSIIKFEMPNSFSDIRLAFVKVKTTYQRFLAVKMSSFMTKYVVVGILGILIASLVTLAFTQYFLVIFVALATVFYWVVGLSGPCLLCKYMCLKPYAQTLCRWINIHVSSLDVHVSKIINVKSLNGLLLKLPYYKVDRKSKPGTADLKKRNSANSNEENASIETTGKLRKKTGDRDINSDKEVDGNTKYKTEPRMQKILGSCEKCTKNTQMTTLYPCEHKFCSSCLENTTKERCTACGKEYIFSI